MIDWNESYEFLCVYVCESKKRNEGAIIPSNSHPYPSNRIATPWQPLKSVFCTDKQYSYFPLKMSNCISHFCKYGKLNH